MPTNVPERPQEARGRNPAGGVLDLDQGELFEPPSLTWALFLRRLLRGESIRKAVGSRIYPESDPDAAADNLSRILEEKHKRHFHVRWLDFVAEELGPEGAEAIVRFVCEKYGYTMPERKPDPVREEERIAHLTATIEAAGKALSAAGDELAALRRAREAKR